MTRLRGTVDKGWGCEQIWITNDLYCSKFMNFKKGKKFSLHFHQGKTESWYVISGEFKLEIINTENGYIETKILKKGDTHTNLPLQPHRLICIEEGTVLEVSTPDSVEDNYRVMPGDSQQIQA